LEDLLLKGLLAGGITLGAAALFPETLVFPFLAVVLGLMLGVYPGVGMARPEDGHPNLQWAVAVLLGGAGLAGLWVSPVLLAGAFFSHFLWSLALEVTVLGSAVPSGFRRFSMTYDLVLGGFSIFVWVVGT
jgi:hypothetical protein